MKLEVETRKKNPLMNREEAWVRFDHEGKATPPRKEILKDIARQMKAKDDCIIIDKIFSTTGKAVSRAKVFVYKKKDEIPKAKLEKMQRRMERKEKAPEAGAPKEGAGAEEKPAEAETPKEEAKPEEAPKKEKIGEEKKEGGKA
jgi:small subunit ribosomal protein S24e